MKQPRSLDEARQLLPRCGISIYAQTPGGMVTLEILEEDADPETPPQQLVWTAGTEAACWEQAFPATEAEEAAPGSFMPAEGTPARAELIASSEIFEPEEVDADEVEDVEPMSETMKTAIAMMDNTHDTTVEVDQAAVDSLFD